MEQFEDMLKDVLNESPDIASDILSLLDCDKDAKNVFVSPEIMCQVMNCLNGDSQEEEVWDEILSVVSPDTIPDEVLFYLIQNGISLVRLCHMELPDKWLYKLIAYDDAPVYCLSKRYYLLDHYSALDFSVFYQKYLYNRDYVTLHLLDLYENAPKRNLLLYLCFKNSEFQEQEKLKEYLIARQIASMIEEEAIADIYHKYKGNNVIMLSVANNLFTPEEILVELSTVKGGVGASKIRKISNEILKLKKFSATNV